MTNNSSVFAEIAAQNVYETQELPAIREKGRSALKRLLPIAQSSSGQSGVVAAFLLGLYDGSRFRFDMTELRRLDRELHEDCMAVLDMDYGPEKNVCDYFLDGSKLFEEMARKWGVRGI